MHDYGKLSLLATAMIGAFLLLAIERIDPVAGVGIITGVVGYLTGNGVLAARRQLPSPAFRRRPDDDTDQQPWDR